MEIFLGKPNQAVVEWCKNHVQPTPPTPVSPVWGEGTCHYELKTEDETITLDEFSLTYNSEMDRYEDFNRIPYMLNSDGSLIRFEGGSSPEKVCDVDLTNAQKRIVKAGPQHIDDEGKTYQTNFIIYWVP